uniref:DUF4953 domain-containing protein n=1 Tax=Steinernema glaseri TaxID=37863 RepID=A0A1I8APJ4_9BILA
MLRLVICAPGRPRGPDCRLDLDQHLVLSYRAFVNDVQLSSWDGLTGAYPSRLFVLPLAQLLRSGTGNPRLAGLDSIMPNGLLEVLQGRGLADMSVLDDPREALRLGYRFDSYRDRYQAMFQVLKQHLPVPQASVEAWLEQPPAQRQQWFAQADLRTSAALLLLEQAGLRRQLLLAQDEVKQRYLSGRELNDTNVAQANSTLQQILANSGFLSKPAELLSGSGYGLPQASERQQLEQASSQRQQQLQRLTGDLDKEVRALL